jgi:small-conductance mechanosensitive channel
MLVLSATGQAQRDVLQVSANASGAPLIISGDTLFVVRAPLGPFTPEERAASIRERLGSIQRLGGPDTVSVREGPAGSDIMVDSSIIMTVTDEDASRAGKLRGALAGEYAGILSRHIQPGIHQTRSILGSGAIALGLLLALALVFWSMSKLFPALYGLLESWEVKRFRPLKVRSWEILNAEGVSALFIILAKGLRLAISLAAVYLFVTSTLSLFPWTQRWNVRPILFGLLLSVLVTIVALVLLRTLNAAFVVLLRKIEGWRGTVIKSVRLKTVEVLSEQRIVELAAGSAKILRVLLFVALGYFYVTILFSFFAFTQTWAAALVGYILNPLGDVLAGFVKYLPNLFFILVIAFVTRYVLRLIKIIFNEIGRGTLALPRFYQDWADPTYKIVRFLILAFAVIVIFPYLPGSDSPIFQGISVFLGVLFSLGSTSAIANIVAGVVLTYMRPFKIGDRVKIADTVGDIQERTLLVTRIRTIKNVDITVPNAMVLGSHIINFSSSAKDPGLILHSSVTIGYQVPWRTVHELLISAAEMTPEVRKNPAPFVLQTGLDDSYVHYEINAYTDQPNLMAVTYSALYQNIQDKFAQAGVEILSPHYSAVRDGNQTAIPEDYLPKSYQAPAFRIFPLAPLFTRKPE